MRAVNGPSQPASKSKDPKKRQMKVQEKKARYAAPAVLIYLTLSTKYLIYMKISNLKVLKCLIYILREESMLEKAETEDHSDESVTNVRGDPVTDIPHSPQTQAAKKVHMYTYIYIRN